MELSSPFLTLLGVMVLLYAMDLAVALPPDALVLRSELGLGYRAFTAAEGGLRVRGDLYLVRAPLLPLGRLYVVAPPPLQLDADGVSPAPPYTLPPSPPRAPVAAVPWQALGKIEREGAVLQFAGQRLRFATMEAARVTQRQLAALRDDAALRQRGLPRLTAADGGDDAMLQRWRFFDLAALELRLLGTGLMLYVFAMLGMLSVSFVPIPWLLAAFCYLVPMLALGWFGFAVRRRFLPRQRAQRWLKLVTALLSPAEAMTASHAISRELLGGHDPLGLAHRLLDADAFARQAARVVRAARSDTGQGSPIELRLWARLAALGVDAEALLAEPAPHAGARAFCPRCHEQYQRAEGGCSNCGGVATRAFASA